MMYLQTYIKAITKRHPTIGPLLWILSVQYIVIQVLVAAAWQHPYDWANNYISDLGNTTCGVSAGLYVCSPLAAMMNISFIIYGITMIFGAKFIYHLFARTSLTLVGFSLMSAAGIGTMMVGMFPENTLGPWHMIGAFLGLGIGNLSIIVLALAIEDIAPWLKGYSIVSGVVSLTAFGLFIMKADLGLGIGGIERVISYPFTVWMIVFGIYLVLRNRNTT